MMAFMDYCIRSDVYLNRLISEDWTLLRKETLSLNLGQKQFFKLNSKLNKIIIIIGA